MDRKRYYFDTRDLLMMAALAALGGVTGTYVNAIGDLFQSILGFAGTTQWAAGLHVLWITLAMGLVGKTGAGTVTGVLKGFVELLSGNTHGVLVLLVDVIAGLLVDVGFLPFSATSRGKGGGTLPAYILAGGLASASNVFVFQLFASLPADTLAFAAMLAVGGLAFVSGAIFAGVLGWGLLNTLRRAGVVKVEIAEPTPPRVKAIAFAASIVLVGAVALYVNSAVQGSATIAIAGAVDAPYTYPDEHGDIEMVSREASLRGVTATYEGVPLTEVIARAAPAEDAEMLIVQASDGYAFFVTTEELRQNPNLLLSPQGRGEDRSYNLVGAESPKAWVRNVNRITVVAAQALEVEGALAAPDAYRPAEWQDVMDSTGIDLGNETRKLQGAPLGAVLESMEPLPAAETVIAHTDTAPVELPLSDVLSQESIRIFTILDESGVTFLIGTMEGKVLAAPVRRLEVR
ncbi:MAG: ECF transporter S component [Anaerolineae bacterium]